MIDEAGVQEQAAAVAAVDTLLYAIEDSLNEIVDRLARHAENASGELTGRMLPTITKVYQAADINLPGDDLAEPLDWSAVKRLREHVEDAVADQGYRVDKVTSRAYGVLNQDISSILPGASEIFGAITEVFGRLIDGLLGALTDNQDFWTVAIDTIRQSIIERQDGLAGPFTTVIDGLIKAANERTGDKDILRDRLQEVIRTSEVRDQAPVDAYIASIMNQPLIVRYFMDIFSVVAASVTILTARIAGQISIIQQGSLAQEQPTPLSVSQLVDLVRIKAVGEDFAHDHARRTGYSPELFDLLRRADERLLDSQPILELWRRSGNDGVLDELYRLGYSQESVAALRTLALAVATPSDVVRFLVRDVFDESAVTRGELDADFELKYNEQAFREAGVSKELARSYWRAHWQLPSPTQGYQMLHRGEIGKEDLRALLKQADYAPGYVEHLINIAYNVPGRIDIRRMYEAGLITTHEELVHYYGLLGYAPEHAEILAQFAERLKVQADEGKADRRYGRIASEIVRSFVVGSLSRVQATDALVGLGFTAERAELRIAEGEYSRQRARADTIRDAIGHQYVRGYATAEATKDRLSSYGFDEAESDYLLAGWAVELELREETDAERHQKDLSKSEILAAFHDGLFERAAAADALVALGYDASEAGVLLSLEDAKQARADAKALEATTRTQYLTRRIELDAARSMLEGLGYTPTKLDALLARWEVEREERRPDISAGQLERMLMQGVIPEETVEERLRQAGYTDADVAALMTLYGTDMSIAEEKLRAQQEQFRIREARLQQQGDRRIDLTERSQDLQGERFNVQQRGLQQRFEQGIESRADLQTQRLEVGQAMQAERIAAQTERDASALAASRDRQSKTIDAQLQRLKLQLDAADKRAAAANQSRADAMAQRERLAAEARSATDTRQRQQLEAQAARQQAQIDAADRRADEANALRAGLAARHEEFMFELAQVRDEYQRLRDIAQEAARARQLGRQEQVQIRKETRGQARRDITAADAAGFEAEYQAVALQRSAAVAEVESRFASLQATISQQRQRQAAARRAEAERALAGATSSLSLLDTIQ